MHYYFYMARTDPQLNLRLPADLKEMLEEAATKNNRSLTSETVDRLLSSFSAGSNPANLAFLMSRMEMRAAEAELDNIELKMMMMEVVWSLTGAMLYFTADQLNSNPEMQKHFASWSESIVDARSRLGEFSGDPNEMSDAALRKLEALELVTNRAKLRFSEVVRQRGDKADGSEGAL